MGKDLKNMNEEEEERYSAECCGAGRGTGDGGVKSYEKRERRSSKKESIYPTPGE